MAVVITGTGVFPFVSCFICGFNVYTMKINSGFNVYTTAILGFVSRQIPTCEPTQLSPLAAVEFVLISTSCVLFVFFNGDVNAVPHELFLQNVSGCGLFDMFWRELCTVMCLNNA